MQKKLTSAIATALAEQVRTRLRDLVKGMDKKIKEDIQSSKEYKQYISLLAKKKDLDEKMQLLSDSICKKHDSKIIRISLGHTNNYDCSLTVNENYSKSSVEAIKNVILIEDYMSGNTENSEEFIERIANQLLKS